MRSEKTVGLRLCGMAFNHVTKLSEIVCRVICSLPGIKIYSLPDVDSDEDEEYKLQVCIKPNLVGEGIFGLL